MNKRAVFLLILLVIFIGCNSNLADKKTTATNDSIQKYLDLAGNDTLDFEKRIKYNDKALGFLDLERNDSLTREYLNLVVYNYLSTNDLNKVKKYAAYYFEKVKKTNDTLGIARYYRYKGGYLKNRKLYDSSFYFYLKSEKLYKKTNDKEGLARVYLMMGMAQNQLNDYLGAELSIQKASSYYKNKYHLEFYICTTILGNIYLDLKQYDKAVIKLEESLVQLKKKNIHIPNNENYWGTSLNNLGNAYKEQQKYTKALYYFKLALKEESLLKRDPSLYGYLLNNIGHCYLKTNYHKNLPFLFHKADRIFDSLQIKNERSIVNIHLSEFFLKEKDSIKAHKYADRALNFAKESNASYYYLTALSHAGSINPKKAPFYIKEYHRINDSVLFAERTSRNQYYKIQLETDEITQQKDTAVKHRTFVIIVALFLLFISILVFIIARQRLKQKELRIKQTEQNTNEEIYQLMLTQESKEEEARQIEKKRIGLELHDGVMNKLVSTRLNLSILSISRDEATVKKCLDYIKDIQNIEKEIRNVAHNLNQEVFSGTNSFNKLLNSYIKDLNRASNTIFKIETDSYIDWNAISNSKKMNLYRIIQEASHNILKHAKAKNAIINIVKVGANINLSITDDGIGLNHSSSKNGIGLQNMKYRIKLLKGKFKISSKTNSGTTINITIPKRD